MTNNGFVRKERTEMMKVASSLKYSIIIIFDGNIIIYYNLKLKFFDQASRRAGESSRLDNFSVIESSIMSPPILEFSIRLNYYRDCICTLAGVIADDGIIGL